MTSPTTGLLDFATEAEIEALRQARAAREDAEAEGYRLTAKAADLERAASSLACEAKAAQADRMRFVVAAVLGEGVAAAPAASAAPAGLGADELNAAAAELHTRAAAKQDEAAKRHGQLRAATIRLFKDCAQRAAAEYLENTRRLTELHAEIGGVQQFLSGFASVKRGITAEVIVGPDWNDLVIPSSEELKPLRGKGFDSWSKRRLAGGDEDTCRKAASRALEDAKSRLRELLGEWPLSGRN